MYLALKIFDEKTIAALRKMGKRNYETADFLEIILNFWKLFNINTTTKHIHIKDPISKPFSDFNSESDSNRISYMKKYVEWLDTWRGIKGRRIKLTPYTFLSVRHSFVSLISFIEYALNSLSI